MVWVGQLGILLGALGIVLTITGLFPGVTGLSYARGIGALQLFVVLSGLALQVLGAFIFARYTYFSCTRASFTQQIAIRLSMTALLFAGLAAVADVFGFGSNVRGVSASSLFFGPLQAIGLIGGYLVASAGVLLYVLAGPRQSQENDREPRDSGADKP